MESTLQKPAFVAGDTIPKTTQTGGRGSAGRPDGSRAGLHLRDEGVGLCRLRHQPRIGYHCPPLL
jgi:hypothetical protein